MNADKLIKLEKNIKLKRKIYSKGIWRNYAFVPPILIVFMGIFGILYLSNSDMLVTVYTIPFILLFILATIWLKAVRKHIIDQKISSQEPFLICRMIPLNKDYSIFSIGNERHNKNYLEKQKKEILGKDENEIPLLTHKLQKKEIKKINATGIYATATPKKNTITKKGENNNESKYLVYKGDKYITYIKNNELTKHL